MQSDYDIFFILPDDTTEVHFPVNPDKLSTKYDGDNKTYDVLNIGEVVLPRIPKLRHFEWQSLFTSHAYQAILNDPQKFHPQKFQPPLYYITLLQGLQMSLSIVRLCVLYLPSAMLPRDRATAFSSLNVQVVIEGFDTEERGGEPGDVYYTLKLIEYRPYTPIKVNYQSADGKVKSNTTKQRNIPTSKLYVGCPVIVNGDFYIGPTSAIQMGTFSGIRATIAYVMQDGAVFPYEIVDASGNTGWVTADQLQSVPNNATH